MTVYIYMYIYVYIYLSIYIERERESISTCSSSNANSPTGSSGGRLASMDMHAWLLGSSIGSHTMASRR